MAERQLTLREYCFKKVKRGELVGLCIEDSQEKINYISVMRSNFPFQKYFEDYVVLEDEWRQVPITVHDGSHVKIQSHILHVKYIDPKDRKHVHVL